MGESLVMLHGFALVCSDPPVVSGYRTNTALIQVLGGNGVAPLHGDDPQQTSPQSRSPAANDANLHPGYPRTVHCEKQTMGN